MNFTFDHFETEIQIDEMSDPNEDFGWDGSDENLIDEMNFESDMEDFEDIRDMEAFSDYPYDESDY